MLNRRAALGTDIINNGVLPDGLLHVSYAVLLLCLSFSPCSAWAQEKRSGAYEFQIEPRPNENFSFAQVQSWLPPDKIHPVGILCLVLHPHGTAGVRLEKPQPWVDLAFRYHCALMSVSFVDGSDPTKVWCKAAQGSGRALAEAIATLSQQGGIAELEKAPVVIAGICAAGQFAYSFSAYAPGRVSAFLTMGGGIHDITLAEKASGTRGILIAATDRGPGPLDNMVELFSTGRKKSALWALALEEIAAYDDGHCSNFAAASLQAAIEHINDPPEKRSKNRIESPVDQMPQLSEKKSAVTATAAMATLEAANPSCVFIDRAAQEAWASPEKSPPNNVLSFVSVPLSKLGSVVPDRADLGIIQSDGADATSIPITKFHVHAAGNSSADQVMVSAVPDVQMCQVIPEGEHQWCIECKPKLAKLPTGSFRIQVPMRFFMKGKQIPGGLSAFLVGRISRDIRPMPTSLNIGTVAGSPVERSIRLISQSKTPIHIDKIESSAPEWATAHVATNDSTAAELRCTFFPPAELKGQGFAGYFLIHASSTNSQTIKVLFFGEAAH